MLRKYEQIVPALKDQMLGLSVVETPVQIINTLTDTDLINIYAEWLSKNKPDDHTTQNGFIFEIISRRFINGKDPSKSQLQSFKDLLMFVINGENQRQIWNEEKSTPDDLLIRKRNHSIEICKIIECKITSHAIKNSYHQKESTKNTVKMLVDVLNGDYQEIKSENGRKIISSAREKLSRIFPLPVALAPDYKYVYVLPSDQVYSSQNRKDANLEVLNLPFSFAEIDNFRQQYFSNLAKYKL